MKPKVPAIFIVSAILALLLAFPACDGLTVTIYGYSCRVGADGVEGVGTVVYIKIGNGFFGIVAGSDGRWNPINLPAAYLQDGLKVKFEAKLRTDIGNTQQWGTMVEILSISRL